MLLRKLNAICSLLAAVLLLNHAISCSVWMLSRGAIVTMVPYAAWVLTGVMAIHAFISIDLAISGHENAEKRKCKSYAKWNVPTIIQRASGILIIVFAGLHIAGTIGYLQPPKIVHAILPPLFFGMALAHVAVSTGKAFITLGIGNAAFVKAVDVIVKVLCVATLIASLVGFYLYLC